MELGKSGDDVSFLYHDTGLVDQNKVVRLEVSVPLHLLSIGLLSLLEVGQVEVAHPDLHLALGSQKLLVPVFQVFHNGEHLSTVDLVVPFCCHESLRLVHDQVPLSVNVLGEDTANHKLGTVDLNMERTIIDGDAEYQR